MKAISLRCLPNNIYLELRRWAALNHRSLQEQIKTILEREVTLIKGSQVFKAKGWRDKLKNRKWGNLVNDIRTERSR